MSSIALIARNPAELEATRDETLRVLRLKREKHLTHIAELQANILEAKENGWKTKALGSARSREMSYVRYYSKLIAATEDGYFIVPNLPMDSFAIRTSKMRPPEYRQHTNRWRNAMSPMKLDPEDGRYVSAYATLTYDPQTRKNGKGELVTHDSWYASDFEEVEFPMTLVHPEIMKATSRAMERKVFDEVGLFTSAGDPMVLGKVHGPRHREVTFVVAWWIDPRDF